MPAFLKLLKLAAKAGPVVFAVVKSFAPQIKRIIAENPQAYTTMTRRLGKLVASHASSEKKGSLPHRVSVLRDQVTYLYASANTYDVASKALFWRNELETIEKALPVLDAMSRRQRAEFERHLSKRLDVLSEVIITASLIDDIEDAEIVESEETSVSQEEENSNPQEKHRDDFRSAHRPTESEDDA